MDNRYVAAAEFKANCLRLMDEVARQRRPIIITKRGKPVARLVPVEEQPLDLFRIAAISVWEAAHLALRGRIALHRPLAQWIGEAVSAPGPRVGI